MEYLKATDPICLEILEAVGIRNAKTFTLRLEAGKMAEIVTDQYIDKECSRKVYKILKKHGLVVEDTPVRRAIRSIIDEARGH